MLGSLGYKTHLLALDVGTFFPSSDDSRYRWQEGPDRWGTDYPSASDFFLPLLTCASYKPGTTANLNASEFCDRRIDREIAHAQSLDASDPQAAAALWAKVDRNITDQSPWLTYVNSRDVELVSSRVGNYVYSAVGGPLLDQLRGAQLGIRFCPGAQPVGGRLPRISVPPPGRGDGGVACHYTRWQRDARSERLWTRLIS